MGKGYNNYMCKKPFHPGSKANIKRAWMAEQKTENDKKKQEELKVQYEKEQDLYNNRALISSESKDKLELNFMYEAPPGAKRERQKEDDEPEFKFEWQRKYNAPREDYARGNEDIKDQPFGIPVRNVRCIKCHKWGHINTDRECPLYSQASASSMPTTSMDPMELMRQMREDGYGLKEHVLGHHLNPKAANQQLIPSDESDPETEFLKSLSTAEKKKLLRKLKKLSKKHEKNKKKKSKKAKKSKGKESSESDSEEDTKKKKKKKKQKKSSSSSSESSTDESMEKKDSKKIKKESSASTSKDEDWKQASKVKPPRDNSEENSTSKEPKKLKHSAHEKDKSEPEHSRKSKSEKKVTQMDYLQSNENRIKESKSKKEESLTSVTSVPSKKESKELNKNKDVIKSNWKSSYSPSSSENEESSKAKSYSVEDKIIKRKAKGNSPDDNVKRIKIEKTDSDKDIPKVSGNKPEHPDGFSHLCPQAKIDSNYLPSTEEYKGKMHDKFRDLYRDDRSPSVKQKYNN